MTDAPDYVGHRARLQDKFMQAGGDALAEYEFLELILTRAIPRRDVKPLAKQLLRRFGTLAGVLTASPEELRDVKGAGDCVVCLFQIITHAGLRIARTALQKGPVLSDWVKLSDYCVMTLATEKVERFVILFLDAKLQLIKAEPQQTGTINHVPVYAREVLKRALNLNATNVILVHNHPSGNAEPSANDLKVTDNLVQVLAAGGIEVCDHLIVGRGNILFSFKSKGLL